MTNPNCEQNREKTSASALRSGFMARELTRSQTSTPASVNSFITFAMAYAFELESDVKQLKPCARDFEVSELRTP